MAEFNPSVSLFKSARSNTPAPDKPSFTSILDLIKNGTYKNEVEGIRKSQLKAERDELKKKLQAVTWSGTFSKRNAESLDTYSYLLCHDIDKLHADNLKHLKKQLSDCTYVYSVFISPSGNGLKVLFRAHEEIIQPDQDGQADFKLAHSWFWNATAKYLDDTYGIIVDPATKDICRLCFVSYDPDLYHNPDATLVDSAFIEKHSPVQEETLPTIKSKYRVNNDADDLTWMLQKCHEIVQKKADYPVNGGFNRYTNLFALKALYYGISENDCWNELSSFFSHVPKYNDQKPVIKSVYSKFSSEHGKYLDNGKPNRPRSSRKTDSKTLSASGQEKIQTASKESGNYNTDVIFWYEVKKQDGKENNFVEYRYSYDDAITFLQNNGFYKYSLGNNKYQLIHVDFANNICEIINELRVKEFMIEFLKQPPEDRHKEFKLVREMFRRGAKNYVSSNVLDGLDYYKPEMKRDTANTAYIYFQNCFLEITKDEIKQKSYDKLECFIWRSQIKDFAFTLSADATSNFERYIQLAITGRKLKDGEKFTELDEKKLLSVNTSIGYMIHQHKKPALAKAVIAVDKKKRSIGEPNGRTGKSLLGKGLAKMLSQCFMDGPNFKFDYDFAWQKVEADTQFINFNDVPKNFPFDRLFGMITEELTINKKKIDNIVIPFAEAPKFYINTNYSLKGDGESNKGRQQIIEFSDYFNSKHSPFNEFNQMFFDDWENDEWNRFYTYMVHCVKIYLQHSLIDFPLENYGLNKLIDAAGEDFVLFMDEHVIDMHDRRPIRLVVKELFEKYVELNKPPTYYKQNTFSKQVRDWARVRNYTINAHKNGERDRLNGVDYWSFEPIDLEPGEQASANNTDDDHLPF